MENKGKVVGFTIVAIPWKAPFKFQESLSYAKATLAPAMIAGGKGEQLCVLCFLDEDRSELDSRASPAS